jgi:hypothetical protein
MTEERGSADIMSGKENSPRFPIRFTPTRVFLAVLWLIGLELLTKEISPPLLYPLLPNRQHEGIGGESYRPVKDARAMTEAADVIEPRAVLIAAILLYFAAARRGKREERLRRRGKILTGIIIFHILLTAPALSLASAGWGDAKFLSVAIVVLAAILRTASWCLVAFHVCEGRLFIPLVGATFSVLPAVTIAEFVFAGDSSRYYADYYFTVHLVVQAAGFAWLFLTLRDYGGGFAALPKGIFPTLRRCGGVFLPISLFYWILFGGFASFFHFLLPHAKWCVYFILIGRDMSEVPLVEYLAAPAFLTLGGKEFNRRSRLLIVAACAAFFPYIFLRAGILEHHILGQSEWKLLRGAVGDLVHGYTITTIWMVFLPLCVLRWWVRGRYWTPVFVGLAGFGITLAAFRVGIGTPHDPGTITLQLIALIIVVAALFLRLPSATRPGLNSRAKS